MNPKVFGILVLLIVLCVFMSIAKPDAFLAANNVENLLTRTAMYGLLGVGVAFVIITGGIDLSIGSMVCLSACLLALFLDVDYRPFDNQRIVAVEGSKQQIVIPSGNDAFGKGDRIRYYGGRRAQSALLTITAVDDGPYTSDDGTISATVLHVDRPLNNDDTYGRIAKVYDVKSFEPGGTADDNVAESAEVTIAGPHPYCAPRDRVTLVHPQSGIKDLQVTAARVDGDNTTLTLAGDLGGKFTSDWLAIPVQRRQRMPIVLGVGLVLAIALGLGLLHGLLVTKMKLQPFVVTLCGLLIYRGVSRWLVNDQVQGFGNEYDKSLSVLATGKLVLAYYPDGEPAFGIPFPFFILIFAGVAAAIFLNKTIWGRYMQALGRNVEAARYSGINTDRVTIMAYVICTGLAAVGGMLFALDSNSVSPSSFGNFFELYAIAAAVLGGCSLRGGEGGIFGVIIGTAVMQILNNLIVLLRISDKLEFAIIGMVLLLGVIADELVKRYMARRRAKK